MKSETRIIQWSKNNWFLLVLFIVLFNFSCEDISTKQPNQNSNESESLQTNNQTDNNRHENSFSEETYNAKIDESVKIRELYVYRRYMGSSENIEPEVSFKIDYTNISDREIKYLYFKYRAKNGVGDYINSADEIDQAYEESRATGPFKSRAKDYDQIEFPDNLHLDSGEYWWQYENRWRNYNISEVEIMISKIEFMDGTVIQGHGKTYSEIVRKRSYDY